MKKNREHSFLAFLILLILVFPANVFAQIIITEIMYDLEGTDTGREWVEIYNDGSGVINLSDWSFYEAETNHRLTIDGPATLNADSYAIIADNAQQFQSEWPDVNVLILDSSFSLKSKDNIGEYIAIRDPDKNDVDGLTYVPLEPANGNGSSLQKIDGVWIAAFPTPGKVNANKQSKNSDDNSASQNQQQKSENMPQFSEEPQISASAGDDRNVIVGADSEFEGKALGLNKEPIENARYLWNFGNGASAEGMKVLHHYDYPGEYIIVLNVSSGKYAASDRVVVKAESADLIISSVQDDFIELFNRSNKELNLSWWRLQVPNSTVHNEQVGNDYFTLPKDTVILPNNKLIFPSSITGLNTMNAKIASLQFPNGTTAYVFNNVPQAPEIQSVDTVVTSQEEVSMPAGQIPFDEEENDKSDIEEEVQPDQNASVLAAVGSLDGRTAVKESGGIYKWLIALFGVIIVSAVSVLFIRKDKKDDIKILE